MVIWSAFVVGGSWVVVVASWVVVSSAVVVEQRVTPEIHSLRKQN